MGAVLVEPNAAAAEADRCELMAEADRLLERVEHLRLMELNLLPRTLAASIGALQARAGGRERALPRGLRGAHNQLFAIQQRLMA
ncbi:MAG: hypothetical protein M3024_14760, partial [Candidatus Dormibacteraeota bacterium]|nr:hypothetical protein [Candidatus Dormibacteraeota bacterium]